MLVDACDAWVCIFIRGHGFYNFTWPLLILKWQLGFWTIAFKINHVFSLPNTARIILSRIHSTQYTLPRRVAQYRVVKYLNIIHVLQKKHSFSEFWTRTLQNCYSILKTCFLVAICTTMYIVVHQHNNVLKRLFKILKTILK